MSKLHEPITELTEDLRIPAERDLPTAVRQAQHRMLLAEIAAEPSATALTFGRRVLATARAFGVRIGLLALLVAVCVMGCLAMSGGREATKTVEVAAATGALTTVAFAARSDGFSASRDVIMRSNRAVGVRHFDAQPNF
jgi:hypothetical protein